MTRTLDLQPAYVLHTRPYRETSLLVEFFTEHEGRLGAVARGARRRQSLYRGLLQSFTPLMIGAKGRGELLTLTHAELGGPLVPLVGSSLVCGLYLNELLLKLLARADAYPDLFKVYVQTLKRLTTTLESSLRCFEYQLLKQLGYEFSLHLEGHSDTPIDAHSMYRFEPNVGLLRVSEVECQYSDYFLYLGSHLISIRKGQYDNPEVLLSAKRLFRQALSQLLGNKPLNTRDLF